VIIFSLNGAIGYTPPFTQQDPNNIDWNPGLADVPDGARILALLHSHPDQAGRINDTTPTDLDWEVYSQFQNLSGSPRGITGDPDMLNYIATTPYSSEQKTYVYRKNSKYTRQTGCSLQ